MLMKMGGAINGAPERTQSTTITIGINWLSALNSSSRFYAALTFQDSSFRISRLDLLESLVQQSLPLLGGVEPQQRSQQALHTPQTTISTTITGDGSGAADLLLRQLPLLLLLDALGQLGQHLGHLSSSRLLGLLSIGFDQ